MVLSESEALLWWRVVTSQMRVVNVCKEKEREVIKVLAVVRESVEYGGAARIEETLGALFSSLTLVEWCNSVDYAAVDE